jgi:hypothetical protein
MGTPLNASIPIITVAFFTMAKRWMDTVMQYIVCIYICNIILFSYIKKWNSNTCYNVAFKYMKKVKWNKPNIKGQIPCDFTYRKQIHKDKK